MAQKKIESKKQKLAKQLLKNKGIDFDSWIEDQCQKVIDDNVDLLITSLQTTKELEE